MEIGRGVEKEVGANAGVIMYISEEDRFGGAE